MKNKFNLSIINPKNIKEDPLFLDKNFVFNFENDFNPNQIHWEFYGYPSDLTKKFVGFDYSLGYIISISNSNIKYGVIHGLIVEFVESDYDFNEYYKVKRTLNDIFIPNANIETNGKKVKFN